MSTVRTSDPIVAVLCADIHLSDKPPAARRGESDWYAAMKRTLDQVSAFADEHQAVVVCAGDVFDRWNSSARLINFALKNLPDMYAVPGQHDLPMHRPDLMYESAFGTLVLAGKIRLLYPKGTRIETSSGAFSAHGYGWGTELGMPPDTGYMGTRLAVVHHFVWANRSQAYVGVDDDSHITRVMKKIEGYHAVIFGDNHHGFGLLNSNVLNCGTLFRRRSNEIYYSPMVGLLHQSGKIDQKLLSTAGEIIEKVEEIVDVVPSADFNLFVKELGKLGTDSLDFTELLKQAMVCCSSDVCGVLKEVMQ